MAESVARLEQIAAQLAARVHDEDPEENARWLAEQLPDPVDWFRLNFALAAAVPTDQSWAKSVEWIAGTATERRLRTFREASAKRRGRAA